MLFYFFLGAYADKSQSDCSLREVVNTLIITVAVKANALIREFIYYKIRYLKTCMHSYIKVDKTNHQELRLYLPTGIYLLETVDRTAELINS